MNLDEELRTLQATLDALSDEERLPFLKGWIAKEQDPVRKRELNAFWGVVQALGAGRSVVPPPQEQVVVLLHGIRTEATWQNKIAQMLRVLPRTHVYSIGYGWFDAVRFLLPAFFGMRTSPREKVLRELRYIRAEHPQADMAVVAHSFATYLMAKILEEHTDVRLSKLILCGSIIPVQYRWDRVRAATNGLKIVNEVGTRDYWPVMARVASWGYGPSGTFGFKTARVQDRYFEYGHSDFFTDDHVNTYWKPFIAQGVVVTSPWETQRPAQGWLASFLSGVPLVKIVVLAATALAAVAIFEIGRAAWMGIVYLLHG